MPPLVLDPALFDPAEAEPELVAMNADLVAMLKTRPGPLDVPADAVRTARREGRGTFPPVVPDPGARQGSVRGRGGHDIPVRILRPEGGTPRGVFLHFHGGGWTFGAAAENDPMLRRFADGTGLAVVSADYRLAPEHVFPVGPQDCEDVALAAVEGRIADEDGPLPADRLAIGGDSAGAHLAVLTLLALRTRLGAMPFRAASLNAGSFDLSLTPSVLASGSADRLVLNGADIAGYVRRFVPAGTDLRSPAVSPLHADLAGLPPALFTCGTCDPLIDDTLFMAARWSAAGNAARLSIHPGGCHVFQAFPSAAALRSVAEMAAFVAAHAGD